ncbi:DUF1217 domain-containing protein, partial [Arenibaculum sp.]|uniref:DUF1217 domain-containing protein n=1 Tax=Arenibaculum sp. TaxID=2865862 RepID=UPI002E1291D9|nr:DUF1217 domain-containing protein [Arenibaculum sp.]
MSTIQNLRLIGVGFARSAAAAPQRIDTAEIDYFESRVGKVADADDLLNDARLLRFTLKAFGLDHYAQSRDFLRRALSEGVGDPASTANRFGDARLKEMVATLGLDQAGAPALDRWDTVSGIVNRWAGDDAELRGRLGNRELEHFRAEIGKVRTSGDLLANDRLYVFVMKAFGLEHAIGERDLARRVLDDGVQSDLATANMLSDPRWKEMATFLSLKESGGANLRKAEYVEAIAGRYLARHPELAHRDNPLLGPHYERRLDMFRGQALNAREIAYFKENAHRIRTPDDLFADDRLYRFVLKAFGLGDQADAKALMRKVVAEGVSDPRSTANRMTDPRFREMVAALGFETVPANLGDTDTVVAVTNRYVAAHPGTTPFGTDFHSRELAYYRGAIRSVRTVDDLMNDQRLLSFVTEAFGLTGALADRALLREVLTDGVPASPGPLDDPRLSDPKLRELAGTFRFEIARSSLQRDEAADHFIGRFTALGFEEQQGEADTGVRLALDFLRKMPEIVHRKGTEKSRLLAVLGDKAMSEVVFTALGLPPEMARMNLDRLVV